MTFVCRQLFIEDIVTAEFHSERRHHYGMYALHQIEASGRRRIYSMLYAFK